MFNAFNTLSRQTQGSALVAVLMVLAVLVSMIIALLQLTISNTAITDNTRDSYQALLSAQAGIDHAFSELNAGKAFPNNHAVGSPSATWGSQQSYAVSTVTNADGTLTITSIGTFNYDQSVGDVTMVQRKLQAVVSQAGGSGKFIDGGFGISSVTLTGNGLTDSYDSGVGTYAAQLAAAPAITVGGVTYPAGSQAAYDLGTGNGGNVGSNGSITLNGNNTVVYGNATPGPHSSVSTGANVTGSTAPAAATVNYPPYVYTVPANAISSSPPGDGGTITAGTYHYSSWTQSGAVTLSGGVVNIYLDGDFKQSSKDTITLAAGTTLNLYQASSGKLSLSGQVSVNTSSNPSNFNIVSASTSSIDVSGQGNIYATIFAPNATVTITGSSSASVYGAVIGKDLKLNGNGTFHYDKAATSPGIPSNVALLSYWEVDI